LQPTLYGPWDYSQAEESFPYDGTASYAIAGEWVSHRGTVEDWGCGVGWMRQFVDGHYVGVDGAWSRFAEKQVDLRTYTSDVECVVMRHVLEHNVAWRDIARNFMASWRERAALVLFIPPQAEEVDTAEPDWAVPDIAVSGPDLFDILEQPGVDIQVTELFYPPDDPIQWGWEGIVLMERA
jgi:hypothetical protein